MEAENIIILVSVTLLLSFISSYIYRVTKIPDVVWLMGFGILIGSGINYIDKALFNEMAPLMSIVALSIILFEAGINVEITSLIDNLGKSTILTLVTVISSIFLVGGIIHLLLPGDFSLLQGMLLGAMVGGTSTVAIFGVFSGIEKSIPNLGNAKIMLTMESIISDPVCIIASITLLKMITQPNVSIFDGFSEIISSFLFSTLFGLGMGLLWSLVLDKLDSSSYSYMISLAVLFPSYIISEQLIGEGAGALTALFFGLSITNYNDIMKKVGLSNEIKIDAKKLREFHGEIVFFIKSFFFVYIGVIVNLSLKYVFLGFTLVILLVAMRYIIVSKIGQVLRFEKEELIISRLVFATGLPSFVMAQLPQIFDPDGLYFLTPGLYPNICMPIVLGTILFSGLIAPIMISRELQSNLIQGTTIITRVDPFSVR